MEEGDLTTWVGVATGGGTILTTGQPVIGGVAEMEITRCLLHTKAAVGMGAEIRMTDEGKVKVHVLCTSSELFEPLTSRPDDRYYDRGGRGPPSRSRGFGQGWGDRDGGGGGGYYDDRRGGGDPYDRRDDYGGGRYNRDDRYVKSLPL